MELVTEEAWSVRREGEMQVKTLEAQLVESKTHLNEYHKMEKELEDIVMQSAQCTSLTGSCREEGKKMFVCSYVCVCTCSRPLV